MMLHDVVTASYQGGYRLELTFDNGKRGIVDFSPYLRRGGVFERFRDVNYFSKFRVNPELGTLTWPDGIDLAPETLYARATGSPLRDWMTQEAALA